MFQGQTVVNINSIVSQDMLPGYDRGRVVSFTNRRINRQRSCGVFVFTFYSLYGIRHADPSSSILSRSALVPEGLYSRERNPELEYLIFDSSTRTLVPLVFGMRALRARCLSANFISVSTSPWRRFTFLRIA